MVSAGEDDGGGMGEFEGGEEVWEVVDVRHCDEEADSSSWVPVRWGVGGEVVELGWS